MRSCLMQAHHNAQNHSDEFVKSALVSLDKLPLLIKELLMYEVCLQLIACLNVMPAMLFERTAIKTLLSGIVW